MKLLLAFSGAYLLSVTVFEFLPDVYGSGNAHVGILIMAGILVQILLEFLSRGAEHGHLHHDENSTKFPWLLLLSLCAHSLLEGFPLNEREHLLHGVVLHKIPVAVILASFLIKSNINKTKTGIFLIFFALMTPLGSWLNHTFETLQKYEVSINAVVIGIFLHISTTIIFEASKNHKFNAGKLLAIIAGIILAYFA
ncbi:ZIP family metal transporter [Salinimicrobium sp. GXAS 041]|uniref:ZIP family metal transporter n=1 Tax=Salinimicrobium sp. GXAS 041 TaxID=3400806 RepID=UPI003C716B8C